MTPQQAKELNVKLLFTTDAKQTDRALKDIEQQSKRTTEALRGTKGAAAEAGGGKAGGGPGSKEEGFIEKAGKFAIKTTLVTAALQGLTKAIDIFGDQSKDVGEKVFKSVLEIGKSIPLIGGIISAAEGLFTSLFFGSSKRNLQKTLEGIPVQQARFAGRQELISGRRQLDQNFEDAQKNAFDTRRNAFQNDARGALLGGLFGGAREAEGPGVSMARDAVDAAKQEEKRAKERLFRSADAADADSIAARDKAEEAMNLRNDILGKDVDLGQFGKKNLSKYDTQLKQAEAVARLKQLESEAAQLQEQASKSQEQNSKALLDLEKQRLAVGKAQVEVEKAQAAAAADMLAKRRSVEEQFGGKSMTDKLAIKFAIERAQKFGFENLDIGEQDIIASSGVGSEFARKERQKIGEKDPILKDIIAKLGETSTADVAENARKLAEQVGKTMKDSEVRFAENVAEAVGSKMGEALESLEKKVSAQIRAIEVGQLQGRLMK